MRVQVQPRSAGLSQSPKGLGCWVQFGWGHVGCGEPLQDFKPGSVWLLFVIHRGPVEEVGAMGTALLWGLRPSLVCSFRSLSANRK